MKKLFIVAVIFIAGLAACTQKEKNSGPFLEDFSGSGSGIFKHNTFGKGDDLRYAC